MNVKNSQLSFDIKDIKANLKMSFPVSFENLGVFLVDITDNIMVGALGASALAAVSLGNSVFSIVFAIISGFTTSITTLSAEADGKRDTLYSQGVFKNSLVLITILSFFIYFLIKVVQLFLADFNQPKEVLILAQPYLNLIALSILPMAIFHSLKHFLYGKSATKYAMQVIFIGNIINIFLNYILINGKWGVPAMGVLGAGIGTLLSRTLMVLLFVGFFYKKKRFKSYLSNFIKTTIDKSILVKILKLGIPSALQILFKVSLILSSVFLAGRLSVASQAANHIALSMAHFAFMFHIGLGVTAVVRTGNQVGKPNIKELVSRLLQSILVIVVCMTCFMGVAIFCAKDQIPFIYVDDYNVCVIASTLLVFAAIFQFLDGFHVFIIGALRGLQDVNIPTLILLVSYWGIGLFSTYYWSQEHLYAEKGIWIGLISSISFAVVLLYLRLKYLVARLD